jgi:hypothetical protein
MFNSYVRLPEGIPYVVGCIMLYPFSKPSPSDSMAGSKRKMMEEEDVQAPTRDGPMS